MGCCDAPGLMPINDAIAKMLASIKPVQTNLPLPLLDAIGHVLAEDINSPIFVPPFANSAMDGFAVRIEDIGQNRALPVAGTSYAGQPFDGTWPQNTCVRIMTGAPVPEGCDAVIMQEKAQVTDQGAIFKTSNIQSQSNIRPKGDDIKQGDLVLPKGARLTARDIPMIASLGISHVNVFRKPRVAFSLPVTS